MQDPLHRRARVRHSYFFFARVRCPVELDGKGKNTTAKLRDAGHARLTSEEGVKGCCDWMARLTPHNAAADGKIVKCLAKHARDARQRAARRPARSQKKGEALAVAVLFHHQRAGSWEQTAQRHPARSFNGGGGGVLTCVPSSGSLACKGLLLEETTSAFPALQWLDELQQRRVE